MHSINQTFCGCTLITQKAVQAQMLTKRLLERATDLTNKVGMRVILQQGQILLLL